MNQILADMEIRSIREDLDALPPGFRALREAAETRIAELQKWTLYQPHGDQWTFRIECEPAAMPRTKATAIGGHARVYTPGTANFWKSQVALAARAVKPPEPIGRRVTIGARGGEKVEALPVIIDILWLHPRPAYLLKASSPAGRIPFLTKPDRDNLDKAVLDTLVSIGFLWDDAVVYSGLLQKVYVAKGESPGAIVRIKEYQNIEDAPIVNIED